MDGKKSYSRPADKSWQAYRDWITSIVKMLNPNAPNNETDADWQRMAAEFWGTDKKKNSRNIGNKQS